MWNLSGLHQAKKGHGGKVMLLCGQTNRVWHYWAGKYPGTVGVLISPSYSKRVPIDPWMPFALDNGAFISWQEKKPWDEEGWRQLIRLARMTGLKPAWATVPDVVSDRNATIERWKQYSEEILALNWPAAFCVQDGMKPEDVPGDASIVFVGGTDRWKFPNLEMWTKNFPRVHCARVNSPRMIESCERLGCESIDGTGWFRDPSRKDKLPFIQSFIEGRRNTNMEFDFSNPAPPSVTGPSESATKGNP
jgi:hypothetical protein